MAIPGMSYDGTCEVHGCQVERLRADLAAANARIERLRIALENISNGALSTREKMQKYASLAFNADAKGE